MTVEEARAVLIDMIEAYGQCCYEDYSEGQINAAFQFVERTLAVFEQAVREDERVSIDEEREEDSPEVYGCMTQEQARSAEAFERVYGPPILQMLEQAEAARKIPAGTKWEGKMLERQAFMAGNRIGKSLSSAREMGIEIDDVSCDCDECNCK